MIFTIILCLLAAYSLTCFVFGLCNQGRFAEVDYTSMALYLLGTILAVGFASL